MIKIIQYQQKKKQEKGRKKNSKTYMLSTEDSTKY